MISFDDLVPSYRRACIRWPDAPGLTMHYKTLTSSSPDGYGLIECIKSFIESVCVTVLREFNQPVPSKKPSLTELFNAALAPLGLSNSRGASNVDKVLSGFNKLADALTAVRNEHGPIAHGRDGFLDTLTRDENRAFLHTGDAILAMLLNALEGTTPDLASTREPYERFQHLNDRIDRSVSVTTDVDTETTPPTIVVTITAIGSAEPIDLRIEASRLLFTIDRKAFIEVMNSTTSRVSEEESGDGELQIPEAASLETVQRTSDVDSLARLVRKYSGRLSPLRVELDRFLRAKRLDRALELNGAVLAASLLATADDNLILDLWKSAVLQARLRIALRRVLVKFGQTVKDATVISDDLLAWLKVQSAHLSSIGIDTGLD